MRSENFNSLFVFIAACFSPFYRARDDDKQVLVLRLHSSAYDNAQIMPGQIPTINHFYMRMKITRQQSIP